MFKIVKEIPKPAGAGSRHSTASKYPFNDMSPGESFFVPKSEMLEGDTEQAFRTRIQKSAANWARRTKPEGRDRYTFTVATMDHDHEPAEGEAKLYSQGDVGVWMD